MPLVPRALSPARLPAAAENTYLKVFRGGVADLRPWPSELVDEAPHCRVSRYEMHPGEEAVPVAMVGSPFDFAQVRMMAPVRRLAALTGGRIVTGLYRALGGAPSPLVRWAFQATAWNRQLTKPLFLFRNLDNREALAHAEAVDRYMASVVAYPGRSFGQLYYRFF